MTQEQEHEHEGKGEGKQTYTPAYVAFPTLMAFVDSIDPKAIPRSIDKSMMQNQSGGVQRKLMSALAFLALTKPGGEVTESLRELVQTKGDPPKRKTVLASILNAAYSKIIKDLDVGSATAKQVNDAFRTSGADGTTLEESIRFYVKARKEAGLPVSKYVSARKVAGASAKPAEKNGGKTRAVDGAGNPSPPITPAGVTEAGDEERGVPEGMMSLPIHFPKKPVGRILIHDDLIEADVAMVTAILTAYAKRRAEPKGTTE